MVHFDFEFLLLLLTLVSGLVWLADILFLRRARERGDCALSSSNRFASPPVR